MDKILAVALWPAGIAVILIVAALLARRPAAAVAAPAGTGPGWLARLGGAPDTTWDSAPGPVTREASRLLILLVAGTILAFGVMALLGLLVTHQGHVIDQPVNRWVGDHLDGWWTRQMTKATQVGNTWTTRSAAVTASVCLAVTWRQRRWLPPAAFVVLAVVQRLVTHVIHLTDPRVGPPGFPHGTFPSGGSERSVVFYGLIAYLLWREFSGRRRTAIWAGGVVAALAFNEGYSRLYLGMHWTTDVLSGWLYGALLLTVFITGVRLVAGPARPGRGAGAGTRTAAEPAGSAAGDVPR